MQSGTRDYPPGIRFATSGLPVVATAKDSFCRAPISEAHCAIQIYIRRNKDCALPNAPYAGFVAKVLASPFVATGARKTGRYGDDRNPLHPGFRRS